MKPDPFLGAAVPHKASDVLRLVGSSWHLGWGFPRVKVYLFFLYAGASAQNGLDSLKSSWKRQKSFQQLKNVHMKSTAIWTVISALASPSCVETIDFWWGWHSVE